MNTFQIKHACIDKSYPRAISRHYELHRCAMRKLIRIVTDGAFKILTLGETLSFINRYFRCVYYCDIDERYSFFLSLKFTDDFEFENFIHLVTDTNVKTFVDKYACLITNKV